MELLITITIALLIIAVLLRFGVIAFDLYIGPRRKKKIRFLITLFFNQITIKGKIMAASLSVSQFIQGQLNPEDRNKKPAPVDDGTASFTSSDESIFTVEQDPTDQLKFKIVAHNPGVAQLDYSADADLDDTETKTITGFLAVEVLPDEAVGFGIVLGEPQDQ